MVGVDPQLLEGAAVGELARQLRVTRSAGAPGMLDNPRSGDEVIQLFDRADKLKKPPQNDLQRLRDTSNELDVRTRAAEELNAPAESWRARSETTTRSTGGVSMP